jgi:hypothetical protein
VREASAEEIAAVEGFGPRQARAVFDHFHRPEAPPEAGAPSEAEIDRALAEEGERPL